MSDAALFPFENTYARLPDRFFAKLPPTPVEAPQLLLLNEALAVELGLDPDSLRSPEAAEILGGNRIPTGAEPIAMAYAGHQFGGWVPQLGDGRAILLGEVVDREGERRDIQLKGSGPTPFSRMGDGRAALGPVLREFLISEAMAALNVPTTRSLAVVTTGEPVFREKPLPGAVLTRVARSHIRVGTFQFFASRRDTDALRLLADHVIDRHYPEARLAENPIRALLDGVVLRQAALVAQWMGVGFIHGVMNTDNMSVAGDTIDYGPCAFMDGYDPATVYSSIDHNGRYAYGNQPGIAHWNLACFAQCLLPLLADDEKTALAIAQEVVDGFPDHYRAQLDTVLAAKIGLPGEDARDAELARDLLHVMTEGGADMTLTFRRLSGGDFDGVRALFADTSSLDTWLASWMARLVEEDLSDEDLQANMRSVNPAYIPRNHLVEEALDAAVERGDLEPALKLRDVLTDPFTDQPGAERYAQPPKPEEMVRATFCGT
jgi:uncharacterized protein YdiU (UPF0061 family)